MRWASWLPTWLAPQQKARTQKSAGSEAVVESEARLPMDDISKKVNSGSQKVGSLVDRSQQMKYKIALRRSEEGYSVSVPGLPGCWSQGSTEKEALENIKDAIQDYLAVVAEQLRGTEVREIEVAV